MAFEAAGSLRDAADAELAASPDGGQKRDQSRAWRCRKKGRKKERNKERKMMSDFTRGAVGAISPPAGQMKILCGNMKFNKIQLYCTVDNLACVSQYVLGNVQ